MMQSLWDCGINGWLAMALMSGAGFLVLVVVLLAIPALVQHLVMRSRHASVR